MAKNSFVMYQSWADMIEALPDAQALQLMRAICAYQKGSEYEITDPVLKAYFDSTVRPEMDSNNKKYQEKVNRVNEINSKSSRNRTEVASKSSRSRTEVASDNEDVDVNDDVDEDESVNEHPSDAKRKTRRHKHGEYGHVLLTDDQYDTLTENHGTEATEAAIKKVDEYCEETGKTYKNYKLVLERWGFKSATARSGTTGGYVDAINHRFDPVAEWMEEHNDGS